MSVAGWISLVMPSTVVNSGLCGCPDWLQSICNIGRWWIFTWMNGEYVPLWEKGREYPAGNTETVNFPPAFCEVDRLYRQIGRQLWGFINAAILFGGRKGRMLCGKQDLMPVSVYLNRYRCLLRWWEWWFIYKMREECWGLAVWQGAGEGQM